MLLSLDVKIEKNNSEFLPLYIENLQLQFNIFAGVLLDHRNAKPTLLEL